MAHGLVVPLSDTDERKYPGPGTSLRGTRSPVLNCFIGYWLFVGGKRNLSCPNPWRGLQLTNALGTSSVVSKTAAFPRWQNGAISIAVPQIQVAMAPANCSRAQLLVWTVSLSGTDSLLSGSIGSKMYNTRSNKTPG
uniref:(northern house mosquito) hypothetical protein n=1 Tax=Culex pipiens TaxID=7175 RepID=A0A8D8AXS5_CULPI